MNIAQEVRPQFTFDGVGINGPDEYRSRVATFTDHDRAAKYGKQFETALNNYDALMFAAEQSLSRFEAIVAQRGGYLGDEFHPIENLRAVLAAVKKGAQPR